MRMMVANGVSERAARAMVAMMLDLIGPDKAVWAVKAGRTWAVWTVTGSGEDITAARRTAIVCKFMLGLPDCA